MSLRELARAHRDYQIGIDFRMTYTAARSWLQNRNPYDDATLKEIWSASGMPNATAPGRPQTPNVYPLSIAPLLTALAWLPFPEAFAIWLVINAAAAGFIARNIVSAKPSDSGRGATFAGAVEPAGPCPTLAPSLPQAAGCILVLGFPLHYGLIVSNLAIITTLLVVLTLRYRDARPGLAGFLFGLALIKYTLCAPLAFLFAVERRWRLLAAAFVTQTLLLGIASIGFAGESPFGWIPQMLATGIGSMSAGAVNHYASLDYTALHVELPSLLFRLAPSMAEWRNVILLLISAITIFACRRPSGSHVKNEFIELRYVVVLAFTMIAVYHRVYDAIVVIAPLVAWLLRYRRSIPYGLASLLWFAAVISMFAGPAVAGGSADVPYILLAFVQTNVPWAMLIVLFVGIAALRSVSRTAERSNRISQEGFDAALTRGA
ncbi:MAG: DUF2029 domain-containing protein [Phycisphaerales bacterium]|nr:DUF2029 domain-containing protein [Phycisphaerales bacterium]MCB9857355.1 DUF2029 domain-containing protein [Phycisphaerales bacterium]